MKRRMLVLWLVPLLAACAAPVPQGDSAAQGQQAKQVVVRDYDAESITGSHLKRRAGIAAWDAQTLSPAALEDWQRGRPGPCNGGCQ
ncbi:MAG: hypothetical protein JF611_05195 [Betaproteobacteria bacterium]|jgi:hypothetical protein|nr:hypothetical protein [Betaproteobacteria bacterium]